MSSISKLCYSESSGTQTANGEWLSWVIMNGRPCSNALSSLPPFAPQRIISSAQTVKNTKKLAVVSMGRFHSLYPAPAPAGFLGVQVNLNLSRKCRTSMNHQEVWQTLDRFGLSVYRGVLCSMPLCLGPRPPESHPGHRHWLISSWTDPGAALPWHRRFAARDICYIWRPEHMLRWSCESAWIPIEWPILIYFGFNHKWQWMILLGIWFKIDINSIIPR